MKRQIAVIGAGLAGTLIANKLAETCHATLLEVGRKDCIGYPEISFAGKPLAAVKTFCTGGGGTTNLWHNGLIPIRGEDITSEVFRSVLFDAQQYIDKTASRLCWVNNPYLQEYDRITSQMDSMAGEIGLSTDGIDCLLYPKNIESWRRTKGSGVFIRPPASILSPTGNP